MFGLGLSFLQIPQEKNTWRRFKGLRVNIFHRQHFKPLTDGTLNVILTDSGDLINVSAAETSACFKESHTHTHTKRGVLAAAADTAVCALKDTHTHTVRMMTCQSFEAQELQLPLGSMLIIKRWGEMKGGRACGSDTFQERGRKSMKAPEGGGGGIRMRGRGRNRWKLSNLNQNQARCQVSCSHLRKMLKGP